MRYRRIGTERIGRKREIRVSAVISLNIISTIKNFIKKKGVGRKFMGLNNPLMILFILFILSKKLRKLA